MQLENYISDLLYRYECVIVPDFGAFLTDYQSAKINEETHTFHPPKKTIAFNEQIQNNDGLLARYIADVEKIPFEVATQKIKKRVAVLKSYLGQGETVTFDTIGELIFNTEGKIVFEPSYNLNYLTDAFGLSQYTSNTINRSTRIHNTSKTEVKTAKTATPIAIAPEKQNSNVIYKYAAAAAVLLALGGLGASKYHNHQVEAHNEIVQQQATEQLETKIQQATFSLNAMPAITLNVTKQTGNYHIIAGAFRVEDNCDKKVEELRALGFSARKIGTNPYGLHQVVYASFETRTAARKALKTIKEKHNKNAWLLAKKLD